MEEGWATDLQSAPENQRSTLLEKRSLAAETLKKSLGSEPLLTTTNACPRTHFLKANNNLRFGFWNVHTMSQLQLEEMHRYHLDILALSKVRWTGSGEQQLDDHSAILNSSIESRHERGVALTMTRETSRSLLKWTPISSRIFVVRFT
ncbi:uncharacterized protein LOC136039637 [Artemia franciscana]|uniref:uncharacterized protein LOC136039637 n=1 Tax=Artemia franciscana TaxID=6661 RepID=UPI0032DA5917